MTGKLHKIITAMGSKPATNCFSGACSVVEINISFTMFQGTRSKVRGGSEAWGIQRKGQLLKSGLLRISVVFMASLIYVFPSAIKNLQEMILKS